MSKKLLLSLASVGVLSVAAFVTYQGNIGGLRSSVVRPAVEPPAYSCAYYIPLIQAYDDLAGSGLSNEPGYDATEGGIMTENHGLIPLCTPEMIAQYGSIGENGIFVPYGASSGSGDSDNSGGDTGTGVTPQNPTTPPVKQPSQLEILLNDWNNAKSTLAGLESELKALTDSKKTLTDRKAVLEKSTGTDSIKAIQTRLASIEKELTAQLTALTKNTKLKSVDDYEPAKAQALAEFDAIVKEMIPFQNQLTTLTNIELKQLNTDLAKLKTNLTALTKIKPQTTQTKTDIASKNKEIAAKNLEITNKNKEITAKKAEIAKIQTRKTAAQTKYNTLKSYEKIIYTFRTKTSNLNTEKATLIQKLSTLTAELTVIKTKLGERLPVLPELIAKQKTLVVETQKVYTDYVATLPTTGTGGTGGETGECNTTTGENCDGGGGGGASTVVSCGLCFHIQDTEVDSPAQCQSAKRTCTDFFWENKFDKNETYDANVYSLYVSGGVSLSQLCKLEKNESVGLSRFELIRHGCVSSFGDACMAIVNAKKEFPEMTSAEFNSKECNFYSGVGREWAEWVLRSLSHKYPDLRIVISWNQNEVFWDKNGIVDSTCTPITYHVVSSSCRRQAGWCHESGSWCRVTKNNQNPSEWVLCTDSQSQQERYESCVLKDGCSLGMSQEQCQEKPECCGDYNGTWQ